MAYSRTPEISTYQTKRIMFNGVDTRRSFGSDRDIGMLNCYYDRHSQENKEREVVVKKRPGLLNYTQFNGLSTTNIFTVIQNSALQRPIFVGQTITVGSAGVNLIVADPDNTVFTENNIGGGQNFGIGFYGTELLRTNGDLEYIFVYGNALIRLNQSLVKIGSTVTLPFNSSNFCVAIDGYVFAVEHGTNKIRSCKLDDPTDWTTLPDPQLAEMSPDAITMLSKVGNYLVVFGTQSTEFFYNAGDSAPAPEFPFRRQAGYAQSIGYSNQLTSSGDTLYFIGNEVGSGLGAFKLENFKIERVSTPAMERRLSLSQVEQGKIVKGDGHSWYLVQTSNESWAYDTDTHLWSVWKNWFGGRLDIGASITMPNLGASICISYSGSAKWYLLQGFQDYDWSGSQFRSYKVEYTTGPVNFDSMNYKSINRLGILGEEGNPASTSDFIVSVVWSDDNTGTWSPPRTIDLNSRSPFLNRLGRFRTRVFKLSYTGTQDVWWKGLELEINSGVN